MGRNRVPVIWRRNPIYCSIAGLILLSGCVTTPTVPQMAWVRTDGRKIADDPALLQQGKSDIAACNANLDTGTATESARGVHGPKGLYFGKGEIRLRTYAQHTRPVPNALSRTVTDRLVIASIGSVDFDHSARDLPTAQGRAAYRPLRKKPLLVVRRSGDAQCRSSTGSRSAGLRKSAAPLGITRIIPWALQTSNRLMEVRGNSG